MEFSQNEFLEQLQDIDSYKFEQFVGELWELQNWDTYVTKGANDGGVDVIAEQSTPFPKKQVIQVKRYRPSNSVGRPDIQQYASIRQEQTDVDTVVVVTTGRFTDGAKEVAKRLNVKLIDGSQLYNLIDALDAFQLAQSYIDPESNRNGTALTDVEGVTTNTPLRNADAVGNSQSITEFDEDTHPYDVPKLLPSLIILRREIANNLQVLQSKLDSAEEAFYKERYFDAVDEYEEVNRQREELKQSIVRYDAGLTYIDNTTIAHLTPTETFTAELTLITERINNHSQEAFRIAERIKGLDLLVTEVCQYMNDIRDHIEVGDQIRRTGKVEEGHLEYEQAKNELEDLHETLEIYQGLVSEYDDAVIENHRGPPEDFSLSELESEISSKLDSFEEHLKVPKAAEDATGSFSTGLLTGNSGLFDNDLIGHIDDTEKLEFVFKLPRRGFKIVFSDGTEETPITMHYKVAPASY
ncbi:restriction endonuclease [Saliphagus sp. GCM10025308]